MCVLLLAALPSLADTLTVAVEEPYLNIYSGAGRGYPIIYVAEKKEHVTIIKQHTQWYLVTLKNGKEGWARQQDLVKTLKLSGDSFTVLQPSISAFENQDFSFGIALGELEKVSNQSAMINWRFTRQLSAQIEYSYALGAVAKNQIVDASILHSPFPHWRFSPYLGIGAGQVWTTPKSPVIGGGDETRRSDMLSATLGLQTYITSRFVLQTEYKRFSALTERDVTEDLEQWKLGIIVFF